MAQLTYKCNRSKDKRPKWLQMILSAVQNFQRHSLEGTRDEFSALKSSLDRFINQMHLGGILASKVTTEIVEDNGETVLFVKRNGTPMLSIYIQ